MHLSALNLDYFFITLDVQLLQVKHLNAFSKQLVWLY